MKIILSAQYFEIFKISSFFYKNIMELKEFAIP